MAKSNLENLNPIQCTLATFLKTPFLNSTLKKNISQYADGESNKIVWDKKETATAWIFNTYRVRNHFVPNPTNPKLKRLEIEKI